MSARSKITAVEYDAIMGLLRPIVHEVMRRFDLAPSTVGKMAARAGQTR